MLLLVRTWWRLFQKRVVRTKFDIYGLLQNSCRQKVEQSCIRTEIANMNETFEWMLWREWVC
jgi:hypothetical protein